MGFRRMHYRSELISRHNRRLTEVDATLDTALDQQDIADNYIQRELSATEFQPTT